MGLGSTWRLLWSAQRAHVDAIALSRAVKDGSWLEYRGSWQQALPPEQADSAGILCLFSKL